MTVQLDEEPFGTSTDNDTCLLPQTKTLHCGRVSECQFTILNAWVGPSVFPSTQIEHERPLNHQGKGIGRPTALQISAPSVGRSLAQGAAHSYKELILLTCAEEGAEGRVKSA